MQLKIKLDLDSPKVRQLLLTGLDSWVQLGLLSESQVKEIAAILSRPLPPVISPAATADDNQLDSHQTDIREASDFIPQPQQTSPEDTEPTPQPVPQKVSWISQAIASLVEEISVIWLLFLGVFLVIVSSGVLAASQWNSFSAVGQYGVLFAYTLAFWVASLWAQKQENLQSTGRMLALTTLLLIPVNFWVIDRFEVLGSALGIGVGFVAAIALTALPLSLSDELMPRRTNRLNLIGLSWLHLGWSLGSLPLLPTLGWPVVATYLGTIGTAANLTAQEKQPIASDRTNIRTGPTADAPKNSDENSDKNSDASSSEAGLAFDVLTVALSVLILLIRSLWIAQVPPSKLGLAAGICGWLLVWLTRHKASRIIWERAGFGLLLIGWLAAVANTPPLQAIAISLLALNLLWTRLHQTWDKLYLLIGLGVGLQTYSLIWSVIPTTFRDRLLTWLSTWFNVGIVEKINWAGIGLFPYLLGMLAFAAYLRRHTTAAIQNAAENDRSDYPEPALGQSLDQITERLALALGFGLALLSFGNPFTCAVNLTLSTLTLIAILKKRRLQPANLFTLAHGVSFLTFVSWIYYIAPDLSTANWARILLGSAIAEFTAHLILPHSPTPHASTESVTRYPSAANCVSQLNTWYAGLGLSFLSYGLLIETHSHHPHWLWLTIPIALTLIANSHRALYPQVAAGLTMGTLAMQLPWMETWPAAIFSFAIATLCMGFNSRIWRSRYTVFFTAGTALLLISSSVWYGLLQHLSNSGSRLLIFWVIAIWSLWLIQRGLIHRSTKKPTEMALRYMRATRIWAAILMVSYLLWTTSLAIVNTVESAVGPADDSYTRYAIAATLILIAALIEFIRYRPIEWRYWSLAWATEIALVNGIALQFSVEDSRLLSHIGIATLALAFGVEIITDWWVMTQQTAETIEQSPYRNSWNGIPIVLASIGLFLGHLEFQAETGLFSLVFSLLLIGIGRRDQYLKVFSYAGLAAFSIGAYELLSYQLSQASGGNVGDGITILAGLALGITLLYRVSSTLIAKFLKLSTPTVEFIGCAHWVISSLLCLIAPLEGFSQPQGIALWTVCSLLLAAYALSNGNRRWAPRTSLFDHISWTWIGLMGIFLCITYNRFTWFPDRTTLFTWGGLLACAIGATLYYIPWEKLGWCAPSTTESNTTEFNITKYNIAASNPADSWRITGLWLPILTLSITANFVTTQGLLLIAAFYAWMAKQSSRVRLSYLSILLLDFALLDYFDSRYWLNPTIISLVFGLSILYIAEVEPALKDNNRRQQKHWVRMLASGIVGLSVLYQTEISEPLLLFAAIALSLAILFIFAGLILKVRAFLYIGTATFIAQILRVLWLFISANSLLLWAVGIVLGLLFIWVAATFESRRSQLSAQLSSWTSALDKWA